jgi:hypothetical protein
MALPARSAYGRILMLSAHSGSDRTAAVGAGCPPEWGAKRQIGVTSSSLRGPVHGMLRPLSP